jgi:hypothetical protein
LRTCRIFLYWGENGSLVNGLMSPSYRGIRNQKRPMNITAGNLPKLSELVWQRSCEEENQRVDPARVVLNRLSFFPEAVDGQDMDFLSAEASEILPPCDYQTSNKINLRVSSKSTTRPVRKYTRKLLSQICDTAKTTRVQQLPDNASFSLSSQLTMDHFPTTWGRPVSSSLSFA